jgi:hypothetical protein
MQGKAQSGLCQKNFIAKSLFRLKDAGWQVEGCFSATVLRGLQGVNSY